MNHVLISWLLVPLLQTPICSAFASSQSSPPIPITVLSGFLGVGKSTLLQHLLNNSEGLKIALVVNDVAEVNIDSKLIQARLKENSIVELQNGCACCSRSEELLGSIADLVTLSDMRSKGDAFDHIVVEMSGVADPKSVRSNFQEAQLYGMPLMERVRLDTMVTVLDCSSYLGHLKSSKTANPEESPELFFRDGAQSDPDQANDIIPGGLLQTLGATEPMVSDNGIAELIVSQTETADVILLNKVDLAREEELEALEETVRALNPRANTVHTTYGKVSPGMILAAAKGRGVVLSGVVDDHKDAVHLVDCEDPDCDDPSHSHEHSHQHSNPSHSHDHNHATTHAGIGSCVYRSRRPFHPGRLLSFLRHLPVRGLPDRKAEPVELTQSAKGSLARVVRSKGFVWCADSHNAALYWSQAGSSFDLTCLGAWWATLDRSQWPTGAVDTILKDFDDPNHNEDDTEWPSVGDRRQEIVFIGQTLAKPSVQKEITEALDRCLLNDIEWKFYVGYKRDEIALADTFPSTLAPEMASY